MVARAMCAFAVCGTALLAADGSAGTARAETRTLSFKQLHTGETVTITFKRNGRYDSEGLKKINYILRDWRRNEATTMDPALLDLVWEVRNAVGSKAPVYVLSGYRSPVTNAMLRSRSRGVAQSSQHMVGKALDFYLPDVPLQRLRETALKYQRGGVGYYPTSGSPFVHLDTGNVRHWPRMTRQQLTKLFPDGKTVHIPSDGKPMPGYNQAVAELKRGAPTRVASVSSSGSSRQQFVATYPRLDPSVPITPAAVSRSTGGSGGRSLIAALFESGEDGDEVGASADVEATPAAEAAPADETPPQAAPTVVASLAPAAPAPVPRLKPAVEIPVVAPAAPTVAVAAVQAPVPTPKPTLVAALGPAAAAPESVTAFAAPLPVEKPLITASVASPALASAGLPRARPLMTGSDAIAMLIAQNAGAESPGEPAAMTPAPLEPQSGPISGPMAATALAATGSVADMPPFAATFTGPEVPLRDRPALVAIDYRPQALRPYMDSDNCLRGETFVVLRHPDQADLGALAAISGPVVVNRFSTGPQLAYPMRRFTGPAVAPVATRTYALASLADAMTTGSLSQRRLERATTYR